MRLLTYREAIAEGLVQAMETDPRVFVMGMGVDDPKGIFGTTLTAFQRFGSERVFDIPLSEDAITGAAIGAALSGLRPVVVHARNDFLLLAMNQLINHAAKWRYMTGGAFSVPLTVRAIIGRGWGQGAQHSQSLQALFAHVPGLKVVMPATPYDAKGLLISSIQEDCPVIFIDHRSLYEYSGPVPDEPYGVPLGKGTIRREGRHVTVVGVSFMAIEALRAAEMLEEEGIEVEVVDPRTVCPLDEEIVFDSLRKTSRLVIADTGWRTCGLAGEVSARVAEKAFSLLKAPIRRVCLPDAPTPTGPTLEAKYYPNAEDIADAVRAVLSYPMATREASDSFRREAVAIGAEPSVRYAEQPEKEFHGPF